MPVHPLSDDEVDHEVTPLNPRVLLADDDPELTELLFDVLREAGCHVELAGDGERLWHILEQQRHKSDPPFDLIVTDVRMPGRTGLEALEALRAYDWSTPVLVMSAYLDLHDTDEALRLGAAAVMCKPFEIREFKQRVEHLLLADPP